MIIKHLVELETVINLESPEPAVKAILNMPEDERNTFFAQAGSEIIAELIEKQNVNEGSTWAKLQVAKVQTV